MTILHHSFQFAVAHTRERKCDRIIQQFFFHIRMSQTDDGEGEEKKALLHSSLALSLFLRTVYVYVC